MGKKATTRQVQCAMLLCAEGYMPSGASALTGNFSQESGASLPTAFRDRHLDHGSQGLAQWRLERLDNYMAFVKAEVPNTSMEDMWDQYGRLDLQVKFVAKELKESYPKLDAALRKGGSVSALAADVCWQYERPSKVAANLANRISQALITFESIPVGAPQARTTNVVAAMDVQADAHDKQKTQGVVAATGGVILGGVATVANVAHHMPWWDWLILAIVIFMIVTGICAYVANSKAAALIRAAKPNVNQDAPKAPEPAQSAKAKPASKTPMTHKSAAKEAEDAAIDKAMHPVKPPAKEAEAHAAVEQDVTGVKPVMSIHRPGDPT